MPAETPSAIVVLSAPEFDGAPRTYLAEHPSRIYAANALRFEGQPGALATHEIPCTTQDVPALVAALETAYKEQAIDFIVLCEQPNLSQVVAQWASSKRIPAFAQGVRIETMRRAQELAATRNRFAWQELSNPTPALEKGIHYYGFCRTEVLDLIRHQPLVVIEAGCGGGSTGAELKRRFPAASVVGIELSEDAAKVASERLDRVICANIETLDFTEAGFAPNSIDTVIFADVLEHLYDPWHLLDRLRPYLAPNAHIIASIPNVRNFWLIGKLLRGNWDYVPEGLLDVTHIRFFTRKSVGELFEQTGYRIEKWSSTKDGRIPPMAAQPGQVVDINNEFLAIKQVKQEDLEELSSLQFLIDAVPSGGEASR